MLLLQATSIEKRYGAEVILERADVAVQTGERVGLVGVNGAGKSTLLKIIANETLPDGGELHLHRGTTIGYLEQASTIESGKTIIDEMRDVFADVFATEKRLRKLEQEMGEPDVLSDERKYNTVTAQYARLTEVFSEAGGFAVEAKIRGVLHGLDFPTSMHARDVRSLSGGQKTRLALARLLLTAPDILVLDEPTNYLDIATLTWLENYLQSYPGAMLTVSHDRYFLDAIVTIIYELNQGKTKRYTGNYSRYIALKAHDHTIEQKNFESQQAEIVRMEDFVRRNIARASTTNLAKSRQKMLERIDRLERPRGEDGQTNFSFDIKRQSGNDVLIMEDTSLTIGERTLCKQVDLHIVRGERVALVGPNGVGKTTLLRTIVGETQFSKGQMRLGSGVQIGYYDQEQHSLSPQQTVIDELWDAFPQLDQTKVRTVLGNFLFSGDDVQKKIADLSGGERSRVALAKLMLEQSNFLLLDEPTNHLDLLSKERLEIALLDYPGTLLFVSHDRYFINKIATRIIELSPTKATSFLGNYDDYAEKVKEREQDALEKQEAMAKIAPISALTGSAKWVSERETARDKARLERARAEKFQQLEDRIARLEQEIAELEEKMCAPETFADADIAKQTTVAYQAKRELVASLYDEWEQAADIQ